MPDDYECQDVDEPEEKISFGELSSMAIWLVIMFLFLVSGMTAGFVCILELFGTKGN